MILRLVRPLTLVVVLLLAALPTAASYNSPECEGSADCWKCRHARWNPDFCWFAGHGETGNCGCVDNSPYGNCAVGGDFCEYIIVYG